MQAANDSADRPYRAAPLRLNSSLKRARLQFDTAAWALLTIGISGCYLNLDASGSKVVLESVSRQFLKGAWLQQAAEKCSTEREDVSEHGFIRAAKLLKMNNSALPKASVQRSGAPKESLSATSSSRAPSEQLCWDNS